MNQNLSNLLENEGPKFLRSLKVHKDTISQIIFNPNK